MSLSQLEIKLTSKLYSMRLYSFGIDQEWNNVIILKLREELTLNIFFVIIKAWSMMRRKISFVVLQISNICHYIVYYVNK